MNQQDNEQVEGVPTLPKPTPPKPPTNSRDPSFVAPDVYSRTPGPNIPDKDPIKKRSLRDHMGNIRHKISNSPTKGLFSVLQLVGGSILLALFINHFIFQSYQVFGLSMTPTLHDGDRLIISKIEKSTSGIGGGEYLPDRGEIIVFRNPRNPDSPQLIKRVIGLPGERVVVVDGNITVFNKANPEGFMPDKLFGLEPGITAGRVDITVPQDHVFVSGDNRTQGGSLDSRNELGTVPLDMIVGNLVLRIMPISDAQAF